MTDTNPSTGAIASLASQYVASRGEAASARQAAEMFTDKAVRADATADELANAIVALGGTVPEFPPVIIEPEVDEPAEPAE